MPKLTYKDVQVEGTPEELAQMMTLFTKSNVEKKYRVASEEVEVKVKKIRRMNMFNPHRKCIMCGDKLPFKHRILCAKQECKDTYWLEKHYLPKHPRSKLKTRKQLGDLTAPVITITDPNANTSGTTI